LITENSNYNLANCDIEISHKINPPSIPARTVKVIGPNLNLLAPIMVRMKIMRADRLTDLRGSCQSILDNSPLKIEVSAKKSTAEAIIPTVAGLIPEIISLTVLFSLNLVKKESIKRMIMKDGKATPIVAKAAPEKAADLYPI